MGVLSQRPPPSRFGTRSVLSLLSIFTLFVLAAIAYTSSGDEHNKRSFNDYIRAKFSNKAAADDTREKYLLGVGKADITGPVVEINFAGYANLDQKGTGLRQRLHSRAFIIGDKSNPKDRFVYIVIDAQSGDTAVRNGVLDGIAALGSEYALYGQQNIALTGTHSHSGPGAWFNYLLPQVTSLGFDKQSYQAIVDGVVLSIKRAHESLQEVRISLFTLAL